MLSATRIHADAATVTVVSDTKDITDWALRYFGGWWNATTVPVPADHSDSLAEGGALLLADVDDTRLAGIETLVGDYDHNEIEYANARTLVARHEDGAVYATQPAERLAYHYDPATSRLVIAGAHAQSVAVAASRLARELIRGQLLRAGFHILHASCVVRNGGSLLTFGPKGAGKTTTALLLAREGFELLANDRVFIRPEGGGLRILPWPSAAAIGFGLLKSTGLYEPLRARILEGEQMHPTQDQRVTDALHAGSTEPIWNAKGKELKPQFFPDQLSSLLGMTLAPRRMPRPFSSLRSTRTPNRAFSTRPASWARRTSSPARPRTATPTFLVSPPRRPPLPPTWPTGSRNYRAAPSSSTTTAVHPARCWPRPPTTSFPRRGKSLLVSRLRRPHDPASPVDWPRQHPRGATMVRQATRP